jgi:hypothetical protein
MPHFKLNAAYGKLRYVSLISPGARITRARSLFTVE